MLSMITIKGDIKIFVNIQNNSPFERKGLDLIYTKKISLKEALIGFKFDITFINEKSLYDYKWR